MQRNLNEDLSINFDEWLRSRMKALRSEGIDCAGSNGADDARELRIALRAVELYASRHPRPAQVNIKQAAEMLGLSSRTVSKIIQFQKIKLNGCGQIPIEEIDKLLASRS
ncbi:helix-turn-helix domain-containing protein [Burkholderia sp. Z1]|uniref:helix-turn-helix domain-containing protein n=1 Tax=Burkholderia sp. Z1 TaxID=2759039 RepID=UPI001D030589|nr:helix-turn-helix domain-containing protein [Burkholderia sp. Z1]